MDMHHDRLVAPEDRVPLKQKIAYGFGAVNDMWGSWFYPTAVWPVFNMFLHVNPTLNITRPLLKIIMHKSEGGRQKRCGFTMPLRKIGAIRLKRLKRIARFCGFEGI